MQWNFVELFVHPQDADYILAGDESPISKVGKKTYGVEWLFSSVHDKAMRRLGFILIALIDVSKRQAYSLSTEQIVRFAEEKEQARLCNKLWYARPQKFVPRRPTERPLGCNPSGNPADGAYSSL